MVDKAEARDRIETLRAKIDLHDRLYYVENDPEISDAAYDELMDELEALEDEHPELVTEASPTQRVGAEPVSELSEIAHIAPMLSLEAVRDADEIADFLERVQAASDDPDAAVIAEPKFDGLSVEVVYEKGRFARASTRGDGDTGEDISHTMRTVRALPLRLEGANDLPDELAVRGEAILPKSSFQAVNKARVEAGQTPFANPRNAAAGLLRRQDPSQAENTRFAVTLYGETGLDRDDVPKQTALLDQLRAMGLPVLGDQERCTSRQEAASFHDRLLQERDELDYEIDGIVLKVDDRATRDALGARSRSPRWAIAWKFPPRAGETRIADIVVSVGRTGALTPVALLDPVDVGGVTVSRATLHNVEELHRNDLRVGDTVRIERAGDVIPEVAERVPRPGVERAEPFEMPMHCPSCGAEVERQGPLSYCPAGIACPAQLTGRLVHYGSRGAMDIEGLGEKTAEQLVSRGLVEDIADLYALSVEELATLDGFAEPSARSLRNAIRDRREVPLDRFLTALGIRHAGADICRRLAHAFGSLDAVRDAPADRIEQVEGIGAETARSIAAFFDEQANREVLARLRDAGVSPQPVETADGALDGKTFVLTGSLDAWTREGATGEIERRGGRVTSSVSGETDFVVVGDDPGSKLDDAREQGVERLDEDAFRRMLNKED